MIPPEILDVLDRVDWSEMHVAMNGAIRTRALVCRCPLEMAFDLRADKWKDAPVSADVRESIIYAADYRCEEHSPLRSEMLRRIQAKTPRVIK